MLTRSAGARLTVVLAVLAGAGCRRKPPPEPTALPVDHLATNEIPAGPQKVFELPIPARSRVLSRYGTTTILSSYTPEQVTTFFRAHVEEGKITTAGTTTSFGGVIVRAEPSRRLTIDVTPARSDQGGLSFITVRDVTPIADDPHATNADRMHDAGLTADGHLLDPKHMY